MGLAVLENAQDVRVYEKLNGEHTLEMVLPRNDPKWEYIQTDNFIKVDGNLYIIRATEEQRDSNGKLLSNIQCEHIFYELLDGYIQHKELINTTAQMTLVDFLTGTRFTANAVSVQGNRDLEVEDVTVVAGINEMLKEWACEMKCAGLPGADGKFLVTLLPERGRNNGVQIRYRKNLKSIKKTTDARGVVTRLYPYGKDGLGIEGATQNKSGLSYIDSPRINDYRIPKKGSHTFNDIEDPDELYKAALEHLATVDTPRITYEVDMLELKALAEYGDIEGIQLGDTVRVIDEELGIDVFARVVEYERHPFDPWRSRVVLANFRPGLTDFLSELQDAKDIIKNITHRGKVNAYWLDGLIQYYSDKIRDSSEFAHAEIRDGKGILLQNANPESPSFGAMYIGPGIFAIANERVNGEWNWRTFGTGEGFTADLISAGRIRSEFIQIGPDTEFAEGYDPGNSVKQGVSYNRVFIDKNGLRVLDPSGIARLILGEYTKGKYGVKAVDGELYGTMIRTGSEGSKTYISLEPTNELKMVKDGKIVVEINAFQSDSSIFLYKDGQQLASLGSYSKNGELFGALRGTAPTRKIALSTGFSGIFVRDNGDMEFTGNTNTRHVFEKKIFATNGIESFGAKNAVVITENYGQRLLYSYEMPESKFGDEGVAELKDGICRIDLDPIFLETMEPNTKETPFIVHLTPYDWLNLRVKEIGDTYFVVEEKEGLSGRFAWQLNGIRKGFTNIRINTTFDESELDDTWEDEVDLASLEEALGLTGDVRDLEVEEITE
nr:phage tail protein [Aneurinibacillus aneurinilyticus]